ncbi:MAG: hypothetical protein A2X51_08205 [Candidatus Rokubacteria bacterium GWC2_70_24]|nr:MAG: hypothetical protein A2X51_08205 [Candidatus Rokubacteria bacterium GWC2_70_24]
MPGPFREPFLAAPTTSFELHPTFGFREEYTDNFTLASRGRTDNFRSTLSSGLNLLINRPRTKGTVSSSVSASQDSATGQGDYQIFPTLNGSVRHTFDPRLSLTVTDSFTRTDEPSQGDQGGLRRERRTFTSNTFSIAADWLLDLIATQSYYRNSVFFGAADTVSHILGFNASTRLGALMGLTGGYEYSLRETSGGTSSASTGTTTTSRSASSESTGHRVFGSLSRRVGQFGSAGVSSSYSIDSTDDNDSRTWNISLVTAYGLPTGLSLSSSIGYSLLDSDRSGTLSTISTNTNASYRFVRAVISLGLFQDFRQTAEEGQDFGVVVTRTMTGTFSYQLTPFINTNLRTSYSRNEPTGSGNTASAQASSTFAAGGGLSWQVLRWLSMVLDYTHTERSTDGSRTLTTGSSTSGSSSSTSSDVSENRAFLSLTASF